MLMARETCFVLGLLLVVNSLVQGKLIYQTLPTRAVVKSGGRVSFLGKAGEPITSCQFWHAPTWSFIDLSLGARSKSTADYEYYGLGLESGECGMTMKNVIDGNDGIIQSRIKTDVNAEWELSASTLRVTDVSKSRLPVFEMIPKRAVVRPGENLTITCNTNRAIEMCHIYLPGGQFLNFDRGVNSEGTNRYQYYGTGLKDGQCGATLLNVDDRINGIVVCKLGDFPETTNGVWETDSLNLVIREAVYQTEPQRVVVRPGGTVTFLGRAGVQITSCQFFHAPSWSIIDLSRGLESKSTNEYEYFGSGLENGECGIKMKNIIDGNDGIIQSRIKTVSNSEWELSASTLRVTEVQQSRLPVFEMKPKRAFLSPGDSLTLTCNTNRAIEMCHIYLPGGQFLDFNRGVNSDETQRYRYYGSGLKDGQCGATLLNVDDRINGIVVCKLGDFPEAVNGVWETDSLNVVTKARSSTSPMKPTTVNPPRVTPPKAPGPKLQCGRVQKQPVGLITFGQGTERGQWPWHVAMYMNNANGLKYICGGSLISPRVVVTAAHCVTTRPSGRAVDPDSLVLYFGKYHLSQWSEQGTQSKQIKDIIVNPNYNVTTYSGDFAILTLQSAVTYTQFVRPVCLWPRDKTDISTIVETSGYVVGWGFDETGVPTPELMMAKLPVVSQLKCIRSDPTFYSLFTSENTFCAGLKNGTSVCRGDSGGGMFFPMRQPDNTVAWFLRGLVSISKSKEVDGGIDRTCDSSDYAIFTDLAKYLRLLTPYTRLK